MENPRLKKDPPVQFMSIPNNLIGKGLLWAMRHYMNKERYSLVTRGRGPKKGFKRSTGFDTPKSHAKRLGVYIKDKWKDKTHEYDRHEEYKQWEADQLVKDTAEALEKAAGLASSLFTPKDEVN